MTEGCPRRNLFERPGRFLLLTIDLRHDISADEITPVLFYFRTH